MKRDSSCKVRILFNGGSIEANVERPETAIDIDHAILAQREAIMYRSQQDYANNTPMTQLDEV